MYQRAQRLRNGRFQADTTANHGNKLEGYVRTARRLLGSKDLVTHILSEGVKSLLEYYWTCYLDEQQGKAKGRQGKGKGKGNGKGKDRKRKARRSNVTNYYLPTGHCGPD